MEAIKKIRSSYLFSKLQQFMKEIDYSEFQQCFRIKKKNYQIKDLQIYQTSIKCLLLIKQSQNIYLDSKEHNLTIFDCKLKKIYQNQIEKQHFISPIDFDMFTIITIKLYIRFQKCIFQNMKIEQIFQQQCYVCLIYLIIGIQVSKNSYLLLLKRTRFQSNFLKKKEKLSSFATIQQRDQQNDENFEKDKPKLLMTQRNLQKRKKRTKNISLKIKDIQVKQFKQNINEILQKSVLTKKKKGFYSYFDKYVITTQKQKKLSNLDNFSFENEKQKQLFGSKLLFKSPKKMMNTQQISSSMKVNLQLNHLNHSYSTKSSNIHMIKSDRSYCLYQKQMKKMQPINQYPNPIFSSKKIVQQNNNNKFTQGYWQRLKIFLKESCKSYQF